LPTVSDASPLIWLSKIGRIALLRKLYGIVMVPEEVYREVVEEGLERGLSDALVVKDSVDEGWIRVSKLNEGEAELCRGMVEHASEIHLGEAQAIALAREEGALLLMDESSGRAFAET
jgi:predicted nucleic acid-binding protein